MIAYTQPDMVEYNGQSLLQYRYCIETDHHCNRVVNRLSPYKLIHSISVDAGRCLVKSIDARVAKRSTAKVCEDEHESITRKCPDFVEVKGTVPAFAGLYRQSHVLENGAPVFDGPGNTALSWSPISQMYYLSSGSVKPFKSTDGPMRGEKLQPTGPSDEYWNNKTHQTNSHPEYSKYCVQWQGNKWFSLDQ